MSSLFLLHLRNSTLRLRTQQQQSRRLHHHLPQLLLPLESQLMPQTAPYTCVEINAPFLKPNSKRFLLLCAFPDLPEVVDNVYQTEMGSENRRSRFLALAGEECILYLGSINREILKTRETASSLNSKKEEDAGIISNLSSPSENICPHRVSGNCASSKGPFSFYLPPCFGWRR